MRGLGGFDDGELVGLTAFREGWIEQLYVLPAMFSRGIGSRLLGKVLADGESRALWAFSRNRRACAFYERHGFKQSLGAPGAGDGISEADLLFVGPVRREGRSSC